MTNSEPSTDDLIDLARRILEESQRLCEMAEEAVRASMTITNARGRHPSPDPPADERSTPAA